MKYVLTNRRLFLQKLATLLAGTLLLVPLVYYDLALPTALYVGALLVIHIVFLYLYFIRTPWRRLVQHKVEFGGRVVAVAFFIYLLGLVKFEGDKGVVIRNILIALLIHGAILLLLMLVRRQPSDTKKL